MSDWETISGPSGADGGWETVPEKISRQEFSGADEKSYDSPIHQGIDWPTQGLFKDTGESDFKTRLLASIKKTPKGKREYLESVYGKGNVQLQPKYSTYAADPEATAYAGYPIGQLEGHDISVRGKDGNWRKFDSAKFTPADIADWGGPAIEVGPNIAAAFVPGGQTPAGQTVATAAGAGVRHGLSAMLGGRDYENPSIEVPMDVGTQAAVTFGVNKGIQGVNAAADWVRNIPARTYLERTGKGIPPDSGLAGKSISPSPVDPVSKGRMEAFERQGIQPAYEQVIPTTTAKSVASAGSSGMTGAQIAQDFYKKEADSAVSKFDDFMGKLGPKVDVTKVADKIEKAQNEARNAIIRNRSGAWNTSMAEAKNATGGKPFIELPDTVKALKAELNNFSPSMPTGDLQIVNEVKHELMRLAKPVYKDKKIVDWVPKKIAVNDLRALHKKYAQGSFVQTQEAADASQAVSGILKRAMDGDVKNYASAMAEQQGTTGAAGALNRAWDDWATNSARLDKISKTTIGRALKTQERSGLADETIVDRALKMQPSELRGFLAILRKSDPEMYKRFPQLVLHNARQKAVVDPAGTISEAANFSMEKFLNALPKNDEAYKMVFRSPGVRQTVGDFQSIFKAYEQSLSHAQKRGFATEARSAAGTTAGSATGQGSWIFFARQMADLVGGKRIAKKMFTKEGINALTTLEKTKGTTFAIESTIGRIFQETANEPNEREQQSVYVPMVTEYEQ